MSYPFTEGRDAAYASNIGDFSGVVAGYLGGPLAYHTWSVGDWAMFKNNRKLPIWVAGDHPEEEAAEAADALIKLGVSRGRPIALDMETRGSTDENYLKVFNSRIFHRSPSDEGWPCFVYGSASTVFRSTGLQGYWVADWTGYPHQYAHNGSTRGIRGTQWAGNVPPGFDITLWADSAVSSMWE